MKKTLLATSILALTAAAPAAYAYQAGDVIVRGGVATVQTNESTSGVVLDGTDLGGKASINNDTQLGLNFAYMLDSYWGVELLAATPFKHDVKIKGVGAGVDGKLGSFKHLPPVLSIVYYPFGNNGSAFKPYVGAGVNHTWFFDQKVSGAAKEAGFTKLEVKDSWGWAAQIGADYMLTENVMFNAQARYIDIDTTAYAHMGSSRAKVDVDVKPWAFMVGVGYKF